MNWNQGAEPAKGQAAAPVRIASGQLTASGSNVTVQLSNVKPGTELTLAWFGPNGWSVTDESQPANGNTMTFAIPKFGTPGRYQAELLGPRLELLGTLDVNV